MGIAMGAGADVARESANVVLIGNDLSKLVDTLGIARRCHRTIMQNFVGTVVVDSIGVGLAAFGFLNPLLAAFILFKVTQFFERLNCIRKQEKREGKSHRPSTLCRPVPVLPVLREL